jgi:CubicO group peptidase (beta-lactamase class C family)
MAAVGTGLGLAITALHLVTGIMWPLVLARQGVAVTAPAFRYDPALAPAGVAQLGPVLDRDLAPAIQSGALEPATGAGLAIGVIEHGTRRVYTYGTTRPDSIFEIGSITKTFTGLVLATMVAQGQVELNDPVRELLPVGLVAKPRGREITLLDLATQHSGLPYMPSNIHPIDKANPFADYHADDLNAYLARHGVAEPPDATFLYSNLGFGLLGQALANRAGVTYGSLVHEEVTKPLGMKDTTDSLSREQQGRLIQGHNNLHHHPVPAWDFDALAGAGAIRSTAGDMLTYLEANLHPEKVSSNTLRAALLSSHRLEAEGPDDMQIALAWLYDNDSGTYWHNGGMAGYNSYAFFNPKGDYGAVALLNTGPGAIPFCDLLGEHLRQRFAGEPAISLGSVVVPAGGGFLGVLRSFFAYWTAIIAAAAFTFCSVLCVQGLAGQLPRWLFLRVSSFLQLAVFGLFVSVYFLQPWVVAPTTLSARQLAWLPSYWFLGIFEQLNGSPVLAPQAWRAWGSLAAVVCGTVVAFAFCYFRTLRKIAEEPDIAPRLGSSAWLPSFGNPRQTALTQFSVRTLLRSRQHRLIVAFYLGIGFALTITFVKILPIQTQLSAGSVGNPWHRVAVPLLASSVILMFFSVLGTRAAFAMPLDLRANWVFRVAPLRGASECLTGSRRALQTLALMPLWAGSALFFLCIWPWRPAVGHLLVLGLLGLAMIEISLASFLKIPFACSYLPGRSNVYRALWLCIAFFILLIYKGAGFELRALEDPAKYATIVLILGIATVFARWRAAALAKSETLQFEDLPPPAVIVLGLHGD